MKNIYVKTLASVMIMLAAAISAGAQEALETGYFIDGYVYKHKLNPAMVPNRGYVSMPFLNITAGTQSNLSFSSLFFPAEDGSLRTFMHPQVSASQVMNNVNPINKLNSSAEEQILGVGFFSMGDFMFTDIDFSLRATENSYVPDDVFAFLKNSNAANGTATYDMSGLSANVLAMMQLSIGQSYKVHPNVHVGYKLKFMFGGAQANLNYNRLTANLSKDLWQINAEGSMTTEPLYFKTKKNSAGEDVYDFSRVSSVGGETVLANSFSNFGLAGDIGVVWDITKDIQVSASVQDIGYIKFNRTYRGDALSSVNYPDASAAGKPIKDQLKDFGDNLEKMLEFKPGEDSGNLKYSQMLPTILRIGAQFRLPVYERFSVGMLYNQQFHNKYGWWDVRGSANYDALDWLALSLTYAYGTFGSQFGGMLDIHVGAFNFYVGADNIPFSYTANALPLKTGTVKLSVGINFLIENYYGRYPRKN